MVPLTSKDLLTKSKLAEIAKSKTAKKQEKTKRDQAEKSANKNQQNTLSVTKEVEPRAKKPPLVLKIDKRRLSNDSDSKSSENSPRIQTKIPKTNDNPKEKTDVKNGKQHTAKPVAKKRSSNDGLIPLNALENAEDELMDTGVNNELKQFPLESDQLVLKNNRE